MGRRGVEFPMEDPQAQSLPYRIAARLFDSAFTACERLPQTEKLMLLREVGKRILQNMPDSSPKEPKPATVVGIETRQQNPDDNESGT
jgi:hypothetical protein